MYKKSINECVVRTKKISSRTNSRLPSNKKFKLNPTNFVDEGSRGLVICSSTKKLRIAAKIKRKREKTETRRDGEEERIFFGPGHVHE